jgi:predicted DNA-binding mobile mystery protein A
MLSCNNLGKVTPPPTGWIKAVRTALGMSLQQLSNRLSITKQSAQEIEQREKEGSIKIKTLRETANALDMQLVYGFVPKDGTLENLIDRKVKELVGNNMTYLAYLENKRIYTDFIHQKKFRFHWRLV